MCYIGIGHRALLPVGCIGKYRGRKVLTPGPGARHFLEANPQETGADRSRRPLCYFVGAEVLK